MIFTIKIRLGQTTWPRDSQEKKQKKNCWIVDFAIPDDHQAKMKESEKRDKYLDLAREPIKLWNMKVTVIPVVINALCTVTKGLVQVLEKLEIRRRVETIQTTALFRSARILRVLKTCCHSDSWGKPSAKAGVKNSELSKIIKMRRTKFSGILRQKQIT